jgi:Zn-dependent M28 family amino/carboxypeptidase
MNIKNNKTETKSKKVFVTPPIFNADSAYYFVEKQLSFGPRVPGTTAHNNCANWLIETLNQFADTVITQPFKARTYDRVTRHGKNIIASFNPKNTNRILLMSHWDSRPFADYDEDKLKHNSPIDGANDGASGVAVLMEMARQFKTKNPNIGVDIVLFDLEDWGPPAELQMHEVESWGLGSQFWSKNPHIYGYSARYGILLDMVGAKNPVFPREIISQQYADFVLEKVWNYAADLGYSDYFVNQQGSYITDDHYFVNTIANIPSIDIIHLDQETSNQSFFEHWHTSHDNLDNIEKSSLKMVGHLVMTVVYNE